MSLYVTRECIELFIDCLVFFRNSECFEFVLLLLNEVGTWIIRRECDVIECIVSIVTLEFRVEEEEQTE